MPAAIAFNFEKRIDREIGLDDVPAALEDGDFCWVNLTGSDATRTAEFLKIFGVPDEESGTPGAIRFHAQKDCIQFRLADVDLIDGRFFSHPSPSTLGRNSCFRCMKCLLLLCLAL